MPALLGKHARTPSLPTTWAPGGSATVSTRRTRQIGWLGLIAALGTLGLLSYGLTPLALPKPRQEPSAPAAVAHAQSSLAASAVPAPFRPVAVERLDPDDTSTWPAPTPALPANATLEERLREWDRIPISTAQHWATWSADGLPHRISYHSRLWGFISPQEDPGGPWEALWRDPDRIASIREGMFEHLRKLEREGKLGPQHWGEGRGIVIVAGNIDTFKRVGVTLRMLRTDLKSRLPIEVVCFQDELPSPDVINGLARWNATVRAAPDISRDPGRKKNWHIKSAAILTSPFREVLYLDSDNLPAIDPDHPTEGLFSSAAFQQHGMFFWPDFWKDVSHNPVWRIIGVQARDEWAQEAGALLFDKSRHLDVLHLSDYMLRDYRLWFTMSDGDKDVFRYAALALRKRWAVPGRHVGAATWTEGDQDFCGHSMIQFDGFGKTAFIHANMLKKIGGDQIKTGERPGQAWGKTRVAEAGFNPDGVVSCDEIANAKHDGRAIRTSKTTAVRRRASLDRGLRTWFRGTAAYGNCLSMRWDDFREDTDQVLSGLLNRMQPDHKPDKDVFIGTDDDFRSPLKDYLWAEDERLRGFEAAYYRAGGIPTGPGDGQSFD